MSKIKIRLKMNMNKYREVEVNKSGTLTEYPYHVNKTFVHPQDKRKLNEWTGQKKNDE